MFKSLMILAPLALSTTALAAPAHYTDSQYIAAARCEALMTSDALGKVDSRGIDAMMKGESRARSPEVQDRADEARADAIRAVRHAGAYGKAQLVAERDGLCRALSGAVMSAAADTPAKTGVN